MAINSVQHRYLCNNIQFYMVQDLIKSLKLTSSPDGSMRGKTCMNGGWKYHLHNVKLNNNNNNNQSRTNGPINAHLTIPQV